MFLRVSVTFIALFLLSCSHNNNLRKLSSTDKYRVEIYGSKWQVDEFRPIIGKSSKILPSKDPTIHLLSSKFRKDPSFVERDLNQIKKVVSWHREFDFSLDHIVNFITEEQYGNYLKAEQLLSLSYKYNKSVKEILTIYDHWMKALFDIDPHNDFNEIKEKVIQRQKSKIQNSIGVEDISSHLIDYIEISLIFNKRPNEIIKRIESIESPNLFNDNYGFHKKALINFFTSKKSMNHIKKCIGSLNFTKENYLYCALTGRAPKSEINNAYPYPWNVHFEAFMSNRLNRKQYLKVKNKLLERKFYPKAGRHYFQHERPFMMFNNVWTDIHINKATIELIKFSRNYNFSIDQVLKEIKLFSKYKEPMEVIKLKERTQSNYVDIKTLEYKIFNKLILEFKSAGMEVKETIYGDHFIQNYRLNLWDVVYTLLELELTYKVDSDNLIELIMKQEFYKNHEEEFVENLKKHLMAAKEVYGQNVKKVYDTDIDFVFNIFKEQTSTRDIFSDNFITALKKEEESLSNERLTHFTFKNNKNNTVGFFGIYDGRETNQINKSDSLLPLERQNKSFRVKERTRSVPILEIRRLAVDKNSGFNFDDLLIFLANYLEENYEKDVMIYAHTDKLGSRVFKNKAGLQVVSERAGKYIMKVKASELISRVRSRSGKCLSNLSVFTRSLN